MLTGLLSLLGGISVTLALVALQRLYVASKGRPAAPRPITGALPAHPSVSVLIPARNEEGNIARCVQAALENGVREIWVFDDQSTDLTADRVTDLTRTDARVHLLRADAPPPPGWMPKPRGLAALADAATSDVFLFLDADVVLKPGAVAAALDSLQRQNLAALSCLGQRESTSFWERIFEVVWPPLILLMMGSLRRASEPDSGVVFASGAFFMMRADAYRRCGGWPAVRSEITEDVCLAARMKSCGLRYCLLDAPELYDVRFYTTLRGLIEGWSKNAYRMVRHLGHGDAYVVLCVLGLLAVGVVPFLLPLFRWVGLASGLSRLQTFGPAVICLGVAALVHKLSFRPVRYAAGLPLAALLSVAVLLNSMAAVLLRRQVRWKGRLFTAGEP